MITFKKMWDDVLLLLSNEEYVDINILEKSNYGFAVEDSDNITFITKDDFSNFWCKLLYYKKLSLEQSLGNEKLIPKYIYNIIKQLPYISESSSVMQLIQ
ncbi:hypothetical protein LGK95_19795 [Clostridium algoriphilum]|uniref:hypothetical protein n=1 Tax=Clostridium algoriphilum TaxID=198347 RepID=UPI001CF2D1D3|nr:hypothetical protein [Clostridium algoriphilum]MCB2295722.1 hypothetical protein [Clostridium algoriphilum]